MSTDRSAARAEPRRWSGPKTAEGKARSAINSIKHGLTSKRLFLPGEDPKEYQTVVDQLIAEHEPEGTLEYQFVDMIAAALWRLTRARGIETALVPPAFGRHARSAQKEFDRLMIYTGVIERELHRATTRLGQLQELRRKRQESCKRAGFDDQRRPLQLRILAARAAKAEPAQEHTAPEHFVFAVGEIPTAPPNAPLIIKRES